MDNDKELASIVATIKEMEESRNIYICENQELSQTIDALEDELEEFEELHKKDTATIDDHEETIQSLKRDNKSLQGKLEMQDLKIEELRSIYRIYEDLKRENANIMKNMSLCESKNSKLKDVINELEEMDKEKSCDLMRQEKHLEQLQVKLNDYRKTVETLAKENECLSKQNEDCKKALEDATSENDKLLEKLRLSEITRLKMEEGNKKFQNCIKHLRNELDNETNQNKTLKKKINDREEDYIKSKREANHLKEHIATLQDVVVEKQTETDRIWAELKKKTEEFETYKSTISNLKHKVESNSKAITSACASRPFSRAQSRSSNRRRNYRSHQMTMQSFNDCKDYPNKLSIIKPGDYVETVGNEYKTVNACCKVEDCLKVGDCDKTIVRGKSHTKCRGTNSQLPESKSKLPIEKLRKKKNKC
uniref:Uncharacterized protein n=1 Tax=Cacopsylla melanoneura TaxID=428564 RepID=A0A8D8RAN2_9HEMI